MELESTPNIRSITRIGELGRTSGSRRNPLAVPRDAGDEVADDGREADALRHVAQDQSSRQADSQRKDEI